MSHEEKLRKIVEIHYRTKALIILGEEEDIHFNTFLQPGSEQRHVLEHIMRAQAAELGVVSGKDEKYIEKNYDKALGHVYRAFFDTADWLGIRFREKIHDLMSPEYTSECIKEALPNYYTEIKPQLEVLNKDIATIRNHKDIGDDNDLLSEVTKYEGVIQKLSDTFDHITEHVPAMEEWNAREWKKLEERKKSENKSFWSKWAWQIVAGIIIAAFTCLITWITMRDSPQ